jgi:hypothetical protein
VTVPVGTTAAGTIAAPAGGPATAGATISPPPVAPPPPGRTNGAGTMTNALAAAVAPAGIVPGWPATPAGATVTGDTIDVVPIEGGEPTPKTEGVPAAGGGAIGDVGRMVIGPGMATTGADNTEAGVAAVEMSLVTGPFVVTVSIAGDGFVERLIVVLAGVLAAEKVTVKMVKT